MSEYIDFIRKQSTGKTEIFSIQPKNSTDEYESLGLIKWYSPWRRYCLFPDAQTIFDVKCLNDINNFITDLMNERKTK